MAEEMAAILAEHGGFEFDAITNPKTVTCFCQKWTVSWERDGGYVDTARKVDAAFWAHQAEVLAANGYGKLEEGCDRTANVPSEGFEFLPTCLGCGETLIHDYYHGELAYRHKETP